VPEGYFEDLNSRILSSVSVAGQPSKQEPRVVRLRPYLLAAASVAVFVVLSYTAIKLFVPDTRLRHDTVITSEDLIYSGLDEVDIFSLEERTSTIPVADGMPEVSKTEIVEYLMLDNIEINDIYEQL
jgi:hypothetical protein